MFTGIVEETGKIKTITEKRALIECSKVLEGTEIGDSIAVNGVCLTVSECGNDCFAVDISPETFKVTALSMLKSGSTVNLERALSLSGRLGGHIVSGHIDGTAKVSSISRNGDFYNLEIELSESELKYAVKKGSITVNGISLTIANIYGNKIAIAIIPHTYDFTGLRELNAGDYVNIEADILAKYVEKFLQMRDNSSGISMDFLKKNGFC